jgi:type-F conjugative transfer system secretin TraK
MSKFLLLLWFIFFLPSCFALQTILIADDQTKRVTISNYELSRIFVKGDRIQNVRGLEGAYILTKDVIQGQIYIKPTPGYQEKPFNLYIATEKGHNFNLVIISKNVLGQDVEIKPITAGREAENWEKGSEYSQILTQLISSMVRDELPSGYSIVYPNAKDKKIKYDDVSLKLRKRYIGKNLYGEEYIIKNISNHPITLSESNFSCEGVRAVAISNLDILSKGQTILYRVVSHE